MQGQLDEMRDEQRPWVMADVKVIDEFRYNADGSANIGLAFLLHNTGHLPALNVFPNIAAISELSPSKVDPIFKAVCSDPGYSMGLSIFAGENPTFPISTNVNKSDLDDYWNKNPWFKGSFHPAVAACILYRAPLQPSSMAPHALSFRVDEGP